tara:strand:- start:2091 stop:2735 length:645 start_codon:yes stop_codon:yes gene_type:complete
MSLVVLKRKSQTKYSKISSKKGDFSINNPRRVESHSNKYQTQTPMKGNVPRGHGSCCGHYPVVIHKSQYNNYDPHVREFVGNKTNTGISVKNNSSSISTRNKWMKSTYPNYVVKNMNAVEYSEYLNSLNGETETSVQESVGTVCNGITHCKKNVSKNIVKKTKIMDYSEYIKSKSFLDKNCLPTPLSKAPIPMSGTGACNTVADNDNVHGNCEK